MNSAHRPDDELAGIRAEKLLRAANPHPVTPLSTEAQSRADATLKGIIGENIPGQETRSRRGLGVAAAAAVVALCASGVMFIGGNPATASAEEVLGRAAEASSEAEKAHDVGVSAVDYLERTDKDAGGAVSTTYRVDAAGAVQSTQEVEGTPGAALLEWAPSVQPKDLLDVTDMHAFVDARFDNAARGALELLLTPGISAAQQRDLYEMLAALDGNEVDVTEGSGADELVTIVREADDLEFSVLPATGQLVSARGVVAPGVDTTVGSMAVLDCVSVVGLQGPDQVSLACADNNQLLTELTWENWGADTATASGVEWLNDCDPFCADGTFTQTPVDVRAYAPTTCGFNTRVYSKLEVAYPEGRSETFDIGCVK